MLYKKNTAKQLDDALFQNPTAEYRGTPFWAWNTRLEREELLWQIEQLKKMGFGGFHMHSRAGMASEYLGKEFMSLVSDCNEKAKQEQMLAWLYDEDRWPSGFAGGYVTKNPRFRQKFMRFTVEKKPDAVDAKEGYETGKPYLLAAYDVCLGEDGTLSSYRKVDGDAPIEGRRWYVYVETPKRTGRFNGETYVDTMCEEAVDEFIRVTHEAYYREVGKDFGGSIPAIFTDEPQFIKKQALPFAESCDDVVLPYTTDFADTFEAEFGIDLLSHLPELLWDLPNGEPSRVRYLYHDHSCDRFTRSFSDRCGKWCREHGIELTGHVMREDNLAWQTDALGEVMRSYRAFGIPGIDVLCDETLLTTAKQCQSAVHQYGREAMLSELYGVTGWEFDFRGHKYQGDWQAALGVTVRVPHLSWVSMKGSAKRDYPASINYQSAWYREYSYIEDHYARINTAMTRGCPVVKVAVIHPIESYWLHYGPQDGTADIRIQMQSNFDSVTNWLLFGTVDFDYISESLLPEQYEESLDAMLHVGVMRYSAVVVPGLETMRRSTLEILEKYRRAGGKLIFMGDCPKYVDAVASDAVRALYDSSRVISFTATALLDAVKEERELSIKDGMGMPTDNLIYQMRQDGESRWIFLAHAKVPTEKARYRRLDPPPQALHISVKGTYAVRVYDTLTGEISPARYEIRNGSTLIQYDLYRSDSLLLRLDPYVEGAPVATAVAKRKPVKTLDCKERVAYRLSEPNVLLLDMARLSEDGERYGEIEELLRLDLQLRAKLDFPKADGQDMQPWLIEEEKIEHYPYLKFTFDSEVEADCRLAYEEATEVMLNGEAVPVLADGYFTDKSIHTMPLPRLRVGMNELIVRVPFGKRTSIENFFLLGDFGVRVTGIEKTVTAKPARVAFGSLVGQGFPFYGANLTYKMEFSLDADSDVAIRTELYRGALIGVKLDGEDLGRIAFSPYKLFKSGLTAGKHTLELTLFGTRANSFACLHNCSTMDWQGPVFWYAKDVDWSYEYQFRELGILKSPVIEVYPTEA